MKVRYQKQNKKSELRLQSTHQLQHETADRVEMENSKVPGTSYDQKFIKHETLYYISTCIEHANLIQTIERVQI